MYLGFVLQDGTAACCLGVRVELHHYSQVLQWVLLENSAPNLFATNDKLIIRYKEQQKQRLKLMQKLLYLNKGVVTKTKSYLGV